MFILFILDTKFSKEVMKLYPKEYVKRDIEVNGKKAKKKFTISKIHLDISYTCKLSSTGFGKKGSLPLYTWSVYISAPGLKDDVVKTLIDSVEYEFPKSMKEENQTKVKTPYKASFKK